MFLPFGMFLGQMLHFTSAYAMLIFYKILPKLTGLQKGRCPLSDPDKFLPRDKQLVQVNVGIRDYRLATSTEFFALFT